MTRTISLITATVGAALLFAVPANADSWGADKAQPADPRSEALNKQYGLGEYAPVDYRSEALNQQYRLGEYAPVNTRSEGFNQSGLGQQAVGSSIEARERALTAKAELTAGSDFYADGFAQAVRAEETVAGPVRDDRFVIDHSQVPVPATESSATRDIDWAQIGIGLGIGLVLALGLFLAMRLTRIRPVAH
jgi:hypothetical protein